MHQDGGKREFPKGKIELDKNEIDKFSAKLHNEFIELMNKKEGGEIFGKIFDVTDNDGKIEYQITLITPKMAYYDNRFIELTRESNSGLSIEEKDFLRGYHPFYFEFSGEVSGDNNLYDFKKIINKWIKMRIYFFNEYSRDEENVLLKGQVIFAASPIVRKNGYLVFGRNVVPIEIPCDFSKLLNNNIEMYNNTNIKDKYEKIIGDSKDIYGKIWNVGQANCISVFFDKEETFFDVGLPKGKEIPCSDNNSSLQNMRKSQPRFIVLSHWDIDHLIGVVEIRKNENYNAYTNCYWIVPDLRLLNEGNRSLSAERLCFYLLKQKMIWLVNNKNKLSVIKKNTIGNELSLWQGDGREEHGGKRNNIGLILRLVYNNMSKQAILFSGDCAYESMCSELKSGNYSVLVSPHHGSKESIPNFKAEDHNSRAVISVGENRYNHPCIEHMQKLLENQFRLYFTAGCKFIQFELGDNQKIHINRELFISNTIAHK